MELVTGLVELLDADPSDNEAQRSFGRNITDGLIEFAAFSEHCAFKEEREWRIICVRSTDPAPLKLCFRSSRGLMVLFVELELPEPTGARAGILPVKHIQYGPTLDPFTVRSSLETYLAELPHFSDVKIEGSLIPLRT
jgi:hypothetical protein